MKTLYLIRHGKAEEFSFLKNDYDRNLIKKGMERSNCIAEKLKQHLNDNQKTIVISSTANRAIQTAEIFCDSINFPIKNIQMEKSIYEAPYQQILQILNTVPDDIEIVLIFGHNPGLSTLTNYLCNSYIELKTAHVAKITLENGFNFKEVSGGTCYLDGVITE